MLKKKALRFAWLLLWNVSTTAEFLFAGSELTESSETISPLTQSPTTPQSPKNLSNTDTVKHKQTLYSPPLSKKRKLPYKDFGTPLPLMMAHVKQRPIQKVSVVRSLKKTGSSDSQDSN